MISLKTENNYLNFSQVRIHRRRYYRGFTASLSGVADKKNNIGLFGSVDGSFSIHNIFTKPFALSVTLDHYDNNSKTRNLLDKIAGESRTVSASYGIFGAFVIL
ncbi:hypothetical protein [Flavobacterium sp. JP2137]|uniref:hypothetical protein n=1 Tax=Flavobacterium sp. JP2137 TaxID=3414510 RepID=UPI003D2FFC19